MRKILIVFFIFIFIFPLFLLNSNAEENSTIYESNITSFNSSSKYNGKQISSNISISDVVTLEIKSSGGNHIDGSGKLVYSNFVEATFNFNISSNHKLIGTDTTIIKDTNTNIDKSWVSKDNDIELDSHHFGLMLVSKENGYGHHDVEQPVYLDNVSGSSATLYFTEDANYYVRFFLKTKTNGEGKQKTVIEFMIPIRTSIYLKDITGIYDVKDNGYYYNSVMIDTAKRKNVSVKVNGVNYNNGDILRNFGNYEFVVESNGFISEKFKFEIYNNLNRICPNFSNLRRKIGDKIYEAESYFSVSYQKIEGLKATFSKDYGVETSFEPNQKFTEPGYYELKFEHKESNYIVKYMILLVHSDNPEYNYNILNQNRFNNFKTKWIEVYDSTNESYYCFDLSEYSLAMACALSIERDKIIDNGYNFEYYGKVYNRISDLTNELNEKAKNLLIIKYYDNNEPKQVKRFSNILFDGTIYLNPDFMFQSVHLSESYKVQLISEDNTVIYVDFNTPISTYNLSSGKYTVVEADAYDNKTEYDVIIDNDKPVLVLETDKGTVNCEDNKVYNCRYFSVNKLIDSLDDYALVKVNDNYYLKNEITEAIFTNQGSYSILTYDRNNNSLDFSINITNDKLYDISEDENMYHIILKDNVNIDKVYINGVKQTDFENLIIEKKNEDIVYLIYLDNNGEKDLIKIELNKQILQENEINNEVQNINEQKPNVNWLLITISSISIISVIVGIVLITNRKEN